MLNIGLACRRKTKEAEAGKPVRNHWTYIFVKWIRIDPRRNTQLNTTNNNILGFLQMAVRDGNNNLIDLVLLHQVKESSIVAQDTDACRGFRRRSFLDMAQDPHAPILVLSQGVSNIKRPLPCPHNDYVTQITRLRASPSDLPPLKKPLPNHEDG